MKYTNPIIPGFYPDPSICKANGKMVVYAKGPSVNGPFTNYPGNPVLTNRNLGGYVIQGCGHADLVEDDKGNFWMVHLAFRQIGRWMTFHITGREVYLVPVTLGDSGWFSAGVGGITPAQVETDRIPESVKQNLKMRDTFADTAVGVDWCFLRRCHEENYSFDNNTYKLYPTNLTVGEKLDSPTLVAIRQRQMNGSIRCKISVPAGEGGICLYMDHDHHYDLAVRRMTAAGGAGDVYMVMTKSVVGGICHVIAESVVTKDTEITLSIELTPTEYGFSSYFTNNGKESCCQLGRLQTRYISTEVVCGFTGVMIALYAYDETLEGRGTEAIEFTDFEINYEV